MRFRNSKEFYYSLEIVKSNFMKPGQKKVANNLNRPTREMAGHSDHLCSSAQIIIMQDFMMSQSGPGSSQQYPSLA